MKTRKVKKIYGNTGISGDNPIILIKIKNVNDVYIIRQFISAMEYFNLKKIKVDLVIIDEERGKEKYINEKIMEYIYSKGISYLINANAGIHIIKYTKIEQGDMNLLYSCSDIILEARNGFLEEQLGS